MFTIRNSGKYANYEDDRLKELRIKIQRADLDYKIFKLQDIKGVLTVYWLLKPHQHQKDFILKCWKDLNDYEVEHKLIKIIEEDIL